MTGTEVKNAVHIAQDSAEATRGRKGLFYFKVQGHSSAWGSGDQGSLHQFLLLHLQSRIQEFMYVTTHPPFFLDTVHDSLSWEWYSLQLRWVFPY